MTSTVRVLAFLAVLCAPGAGVAQDAGDYPNRPVKLVVPFAAGGPSDAMARLIAQELSESLGKPFFVANHPGVAVPGAIPATAVIELASSTWRRCIAAPLNFRW